MYLLVTVLMQKLGELAALTAPAELPDCQLHALGKCNAACQTNSSLVLP